MRAPLLAAVLALPLFAAAVRAEEAVFEERPYRLEWPKGKVAGVLVYLHGVSTEAPLEVERGRMDALARHANERGLAALFPTGKRDRGYLPPPQANAFCWSHLDIPTDLDYLSRLVESVEKARGATFARREIIGFSNGAYLLGGALQRGLLKGYARAGVVSGGGVGSQAPTAAPEFDVFVEVGTGDEWNVEPVRQLVKLLQAGHFGDRLHSREVAGGHELDEPRLKAFLAWFWSDDPSPATPESVKEKIAALDLDGAKKLLARVKADAKDADARKAAKDLDHEIEIAKRIEPVAKKLPELLDKQKPRDALAAAWAAADEFPGAVALAALLPRTREARKVGFFEIDTFDAATKDEKGAAKPVLNWEARRAAVSFVDDPMGGHALRWKCEAKSQKSYLVRKFADPIRADDFEYVIMRLRAAKTPSGNFDIGLVCDQGYATLNFKVEAGDRWREVRVPLEPSSTHGLYEPDKIVSFNLYYEGSDAIDVTVDEVLAALKKPR